MLYQFGRAKWRFHRILNPRPFRAGVASGYGTDTFNLDSLWNETLTAMLSHRSIRAYLPDLLPPQTLELLIAAAQSAATSSNLQTWSVVAIEDPARKEILAQLAGNQAHIRQCPLFLVWLADLARLHHLAIQRGLPAQGLDYLEMFVTATIDAALAAQNATVAAESLGLGTVYIGGMRNHPEKVAETLQLPPHLFAVFGLCVGYLDPAKPAAVKPRLPQAAVLHRETYHLSQQAEAISEYNDIMQKFYESQRMNVAGDWVEHSLKRVATAQALNGRDRLKEILQKLGFPLL
ncbi:NADPH-dependent oxidoreductase [Planktothrix sp. FACHB-1355]|uniref:NADPH-dependent oxidoreductase n=1 Tax=Aerosakkonema funiforme FACHB-1375 TaxID=2949571 RepID=A0A926ZJS8_9CYAN|nr:MULTISPECIES: NADPH-dependent oxidoreductase [Oscillatoriales]MBD2184687.1 NADPH-dependent oxidoreductase [Aerosakkonema funiforme FACHB-1375]MBD3559596.1 NADPH-dependent oxidoreductase [Planktothrix sp. FACHB-1355]